MKSVVSLGAVLICSILMSACSSITAETSANELVAQAMARQISHDNRYNFEGKAYLKLEKYQSDSEQNHPAAKALVDDAVSAIYHADNATSQNGTHLTRDEKMAQLMAKYGNRWLGAFSMPYTGAVDLPNGRMEIVPELRMQTRLSQSSVKLPIMLDFKEGAFYADPEAISFWTDPIMEIFHLPAVDNRLIAFKLSAEQKSRIPLKNIFKAMPNATKHGYAALPAHAFQKKEMDEFGKNIKAKYRIFSELSWADYGKMGEHGLQALRDDLVQQGAEDGVSAADYQNTVDFLDKILQQQRELNEEMLKHETAVEQKTKSIAEQIASQNRYQENDVAKQAAKRKMVETKKVLDGFRLQENTYLDGKGRLMAKRTKLLLPKELDKELAQLLGQTQTVRLYADSHYSYTKKPVFTLQPNQQNVLDLNELLNKSQKSERTEKVDMQ